MKYRILYFTFFYYFDVSTPCFINTVKSGVCGPPKGRTIVAEFQVFRSVTRKVGDDVLPFCRYNKQISDVLTFIVISFMLSNCLLNHKINYFMYG